MPNPLSRQGHRLLQIGVALFLFFSALEGMVIPYFPQPRQGLSVHTLSALEGVVLVALGLVWPRLTLGPRASTLALWLLVYSALATLAPYVLAAIWGAGNTIMPLAAGPARGTALQEAIIAVVLISSAPAVLIALVMILWSLRLGAPGSGGSSNNY